MNVKEFLDKFVSETRSMIERVEAYAHLSGEEKKRIVDEWATTVYDQNFDKVKLPFLIKGWVKKSLRKQIPSLTQKIYDLIKDYIKGITKTA